MANRPEDEQLQHKLSPVHVISQSCAASHALTQLICLQDAVKLALTISKQMAMAVANRPEDDEQLQRKLWLAIARHLVQSACDPEGGDSAVSCAELCMAAHVHAQLGALAQIAAAAAAKMLTFAHATGICVHCSLPWEGGKWSASQQPAAPVTSPPDLRTLAQAGIAQVTDLLRDAGGLVKIEDILPLFPDFVTIDAFRDAIHESLEQYSAHIDQLKQEMADATRIADALRCMALHKGQAGQSMLQEAKAVQCPHPPAEAGYGERISHLWHRQAQMQQYGASLIAMRVLSAASWQLTALVFNYGTAVTAYQWYKLTRPTACRKDMASLQKRTATLDLSQPCARCQLPLGSPPPPSIGPRGGALPQLYLFPTGNAFHGVCAAAEVASLVIPAQAAKIKELVAQLAQVGTALLIA